MMRVYLGYGGAWCGFIGALLLRNVPAHPPPIFETLVVYVGIPAFVLCVGFLLLPRRWADEIDDGTHRGAIRQSTLMWLGFLSGGASILVWTVAYHTGIIESVVEFKRAIAAPALVTATVILFAGPLWLVTWLCTRHVRRVS